MEVEGFGFYLGSYQVRVMVAVTVEVGSGGWLVLYFPGGGVEFRGSSRHDFCWVDQPRTERRRRGVSE